MSSTALTVSRRSLALGLFELDAAGDVTRYEPAPGPAETAPPAGEVVGLNFFDDIAPVAEVARVRGRFRAFMTFGDAEQNLIFTFPFDRIVVRACLTLARVNGSADTGGARRAVMLLRRES